MTIRPDWYQQMLHEYHQDGRKDAEQGLFRPPYPSACEDCDPDDADVNEHYKTGFQERRKELGGEI